MILFTAAACAAVSAWLFLAGSVNVSGRRIPPHRGVVTLLSAVRRRWLARGSREETRHAVREALTEMVADLRAGQSASRAAERALGSGNRPVAPSAVAALRWGGDVVAALRADAQRQRCELLVSAAACWSVAQASGAGLAHALDRVVQQDRKADEVRRQLSAHLAAPRATARMLAALPLVGVGLGFVIGGDPVAWLTGTALGWSCLVVGGGLTALGLVWARGIAARTERLL